MLLLFSVSDRGKGHSSFVCEKIIVLMNWQCNFLRALRDVNAISKVKEKAVEPASAPDTILVQVEVDNMVEDFDFNFDGATDSNDAVHNAEAAVSAPVLPCHEMSESPERHERLTVDAKILRMVHKVIEYYMLLIPNSVLQEKFDVLKLLDEHVKWSPQQTLNEAVDNWNVTADSTLTLSILHILKLCSKGHCRWYRMQAYKVSFHVHSYASLPVVFS